MSRPQVEDITPAELDALRQSEEAFLLVDVRGADEQQVLVPRRFCLS